MAKLSDAQINALKFYANSDGTAPQKRTRDSLVKNGFLNEDNTLTDDAFDALGWERPSTVLEEITELLNTNPWDVAPSLPAGWNMTPRNRKVWEGLTEDEIKADIATARPVANRKDIRSGNVLKSKHF